MVYSSVEFCAFLALVWAACLVGRRQAARLWPLLAASLVFFAWAGLFDLAVFLLATAGSYAALRLAERYPARRRLLVHGAAWALIAHLAFWKYSPLSLPLPVGISFYTFTAIAFLIDYERGKAGLMPLHEYVLFHSFFGHLIAGPIVRAGELASQVRCLPTPTAADTAVGLSLFARGLFKKMVIADRVAPFVDFVFAAPTRFDRASLAWALASFLIQLWGDFSGYTDMGRGAARLLGIRLPENFLTPLLCRKPSELWERWHVTLTRWMRDYIWAPLSWSRLSVLATFLLVGLWHGASWCFVVWGVYFRLIVIAERMLERSRAGRLWTRLLPELARHPLSAACTFALVALGCLLFRATSLSTCVEYIYALAHGPVPGSEIALSPRVLSELAYPSIALAVGLELFFYHSLERREWLLLARLRESGALDRARAALERPAVAGAAGLAYGALLGVVAAASIALRPSENFAPFVYFQF